MYKNDIGGLQLMYIDNNDLLVKKHSYDGGVNKEGAILQMSNASSLWQPSMTDLWKMTDEASVGLADTVMQAFVKNQPEAVDSALKVLRLHLVPATDAAVPAITAITATLAAGRGPEAAARRRVRARRETVRGADASVEERRVGVRRCARVWLRTVQRRIQYSVMSCYTVHGLDVTVAAMCVSPPTCRLGVLLDDRRIHIPQSCMFLRPTLRRTTNSRAHAHALY
eukprot:4626691-Prymnesium_polylepis.1